MNRGAAVLVAPEISSISSSLSTPLLGTAPESDTCSIWCCFRERYADPLSVRIKTWFLDLVTVTTDRATRLSAVRRMEFKQRNRRMAAGHSHPLAAADRSDACWFLNHVSTKLGKVRFDGSLSVRDKRSGAIGSRLVRQPKDLLVPSSYAKLPRDAFVTLIDTDYHMSAKELAVYAGRDFGIYGLRPNGLSGVTSDSQWRFVSQDTVVEEVAGGAVYRHQVWDWGKDMYVMGRWCNTYVYDPVVFDTSDGRIVVILLLARTLKVPLFLANWLVPGLGDHVPSRMRVEKQGNYLVSSFGKPGHRRVHVLPVDGGLGVNSTVVKHDTFTALGLAAKIPNTDRQIAGFELLPSAVERLVKRCDDNVTGSGCHVLSDYFTKAYRPHQLCNYQAKGSLELEDGEPTTYVAGIPLVGAGCGPTSSSNNEARAIKARLVDVANDAKFPQDLIDYGVEFSRLVVPREGQLVPASVQELRLAQDRPSQRARRLEEDKHAADPSNSLKTVSFQKKETYQKPGDPRLINQVTTDHTNRLCTFALAIKPLLKKLRFYAVGKNPLELAHAIRGLQKSAGSQLVGGDYSRMDGRTSLAYRQYVLKPIYMRAFSKPHHKELQLLLSREERTRTVTRGAGHRAALSGANVSGSGVTTDLNTLDAAFNEYAARRKLGESEALAFRNLGLYFGDDSLVRGDVFSKVVEVAEIGGMKLEKEPVPVDAGPGYAVFLSRVYPDVSTSLSSHPVVVRSLRKQCTVQGSAKTGRKELMRRLSLKVGAFRATDSHVPVMSVYAEALWRVHELGGLSGKGDQSTEKRNFERKSTIGPYPYVPGDRDLLLASVANGLGIGVEEAVLLEERLKAAKTTDDLARLGQECPGMEPPEWAIPVPTETVA